MGIFHWSDITKSNMINPRGWLILYIEQTFSWSFQECSTDYTRTIKNKSTNDSSFFLFLFFTLLLSLRSGHGAQAGLTSSPACAGCIGAHYECVLSKPGWPQCLQSLGEVKSALFLSLSIHHSSHHSGCSIIVWYVWRYLGYIQSRNG